MKFNLENATDRVFHIAKESEFTPVQYSPPRFVSASLTIILTLQEGMMINGRQRWMNSILAAAGAMLLLFNGLAAPVSLALSETEFCAMECCVAEGRCCCVARKPRGQKTDNAPAVDQNQIFSKCPYSCAFSSKPNQRLRTIARPVAYDHVLAKKIPASYGASTPLHNPAWFALNSPRAPPPFN